MPAKYDILAGLPYPLGAQFDGQGVNFALYSSSATRVQLCLFNAKGTGEVRIDLPQYTDEVFHGYIKGLKPGQLYGYRVYGPYEPEKGLRFNPYKLLIDPYAKQLTGPIISSNTMLGYVPLSKKEDLSFNRQNSAPFVPKCIVTDDNAFRPSVNKPKVPWGETVIYEAHLKGFTACHPGVDKDIRGTCAGMSSKKVVEYIKSLGVTAVELLPVASFMTSGFLTDKGLTNYWGYDPVAFMAPHAPYLSSGGIDEFKHMVQVFHEAGIEVILDVVYNHTGEGNHMGQTICYRGIDNGAYYRLNAEKPRYYDDTTGCGASFNLGHPRALQLVMDSLRYWADKVQIDGFRFDLATTLARDGHNTFAQNSDFLTVIQQDPTLQRLKLIAEPWDLGNGGYQVGSFRPGWAEWNDKFRDTMRKFWKGDFGQANEFAYRLMGSSDVYQHKGRKPWESVNFITAHDGFTLNDLVSYNQKHNEANQEGNRDGTDNNLSWNSGAEGETKDENILALRERRARGLMASLLLSFGTPMIRAGDEILDTDCGNNNTYAQDNELTWIDWERMKEPQVERMLEMVRDILRIRRHYSAMEAADFFAPDAVTWCRPDGGKMTPEDWQPFVRSLSCIIHNENKAVFLIFNGFDEDIKWALPEGKGRTWKLVGDTTQTGEKGKAFKTYTVPAWSVVMFEQG